ncbi:MAG TPA: DUF1697 domain-containing protein [Segetibacter sp.]|jgi:uncharacterized protein (DUF1697 family)
METYISILRGINVSGHRKIEMAGLKALYEELKFKEVVTYIQSGNVIFKTGETSAGSILKTIEKAIADRYHFHVPVIVRSLPEMARIISANPFLKENDIDIEKLHVTFLAEAPEFSKIESLKNVQHPPDKFIIAENDIYLYCPGGYGNTKLSNNFFENKLKVTATTRNWKTVNKLVGLAKST